jgi:hypothetical protein
MQQVGGVATGFEASTGKAGEEAVNDGVGKRTPQSHQTHGFSMHRACGSRRYNVEAKIP